MQTLNASILQILCAVNYIRPLLALTMPVRHKWVADMIAHT